MVARSFIIFGLVCYIAVVLSTSFTTKAGKRSKRAAYELPADAELLVGQYKTTFSCEGLRYGYYADVDNDCRIFHVCHEVTLANGQQQIQQWSFVCGNQTMFNQLSLTCAHPEESVPCSNARDFYYVNDVFGIEDSPSLKDDDVAKGVALYPGWGQRIKRK